MQQGGGELAGVRCGCTNDLQADVDERRDGARFFTCERPKVAKRRHLVLLQHHVHLQPLGADRHRRDEHWGRTRRGFCVRLRGVLLLTMQEFITPVWSSYSSTYYKYLVP